MEDVSYQQFVFQLTKKMPTAEMDLIHSAMGISGEAGEFTDAVKKHAIYGKPLDRENVKEELGDICFYTFQAMNVMGFTFEEVINYNVNKLQKRYHEGIYSDAQAIARADKDDEPDEQSALTSHS